MKRLLFFLLGPLVVFTFAASGQASPPSPASALADEYLAAYFAAYPEYGTFYRIAEADNAGLSDNSTAGVQRWQATEAALFKKLQAVNKSRLSPQDVGTYATLYEQLEGDLGCKVCKQELWAVSQMTGWQTSFSYLADVQPVETAQNRAQTLARWGRIPRYIQREISNLKEGLRTQYTAPRQNVRLVIAQLEALEQQPAAKSFFYAPARRDSTQAFAQELQRIIENEIYPQLRAYKRFLVTEYLDKAREQPSLAALPNGAACYQALLRSSTTLKSTSEAVYQDGLRAVAQREAKIKELGKKVYATDDLTKLRALMRQGTTNRFASSAALLAFSNAAVQRAKAKSGAYFNLLPTAALEIKPMPAYQKDGFSHYTPASDDGKQPATYYIQGHQFDQQNRGDVETTAFHEGYPGHHLQIGVARERLTARPLAKYIGNSGFSEGWARYTETLADEMGLYSSDRNRLSAYAGLPTGMVVDPGIHVKGWTRAQAIAYTLDKQPGMSRDQAEAYVDRIAVMPGQMTTYGVGEMFFWNLRNRARAAFGNRFDVKAFHDKCLELGSVPLQEVEQHVTAWIQQAANAPAVAK
ncbi:MAG: DUF885 domain-containing protein [Hymenobacter sp.]|nr:DUF885 domain-containing protein [Hymenobacter sp.]